MAALPSPKWYAWAGLMLGPIAWGLDQQITSTWAYAQCHTGVGRAILVGVVCMLIAGAGGVLSWRRWRSVRDDHEVDHAHRFFAMLSVMSAAFFMLVIIVGTSAAVILQECVR